MLAIWNALLHISGPMPAAPTCWQTGAAASTRGRTRSRSPASKRGERSRPLDILLIMSDDVGHGDTELAAGDPRGHAADLPRTPHLAALARAPGAVVLDHFYVQPLCSASRSALLTGRYPIHTGMQTHVLQPQQRRGLPLEEVTVAERLKELGYTTHLVGKWHQGYSRWAYTPRWRGFDSFFGMFTGASDHYNHRMSTTNHTVPNRGPVKGPIDLRRDEAPVASAGGVHSSDLYADEAVAIIESHQAARRRAASEAGGGEEPPPAFLMVSFQAAHDPIQTPFGWAERNSHITDPYRRQLAGLVSHLDAAIGRVVGAARSSLGWSSTLVVYMSDNGGVPYLGSSNYPFRGAKGGVWEGGVRTQLLVSGGALLPPQLPQHQLQMGESAPAGPFRRLSMLAHVTDLFPTILAAAREGSVTARRASGRGGASPANHRPANGPLDGFNLWPQLRAAASMDPHPPPRIEGPRRDVLLNIDEIGYPLRPPGARGGRGGGAGGGGAGGGGAGGGGAGATVLSRFDPMGGLRSRLRRTLARTLGWADRSAALLAGRHKIILGTAGAPLVAEREHNTSRSAAEMAALMAGSEQLAGRDARRTWPLAARLDQAFPRHASAFPEWEVEPLWLFDVESDPGERSNLLIDPTPGDVAIAEALLTQLARYYAGAVSPPVNAQGTFSHGWREHVGFFPPRHGGFVAPFDEPGVPLHGAWLAYATFGTVLALALMLLPFLPLVGAAAYARRVFGALLATSARRQGGRAWGGWGRGAAAPREREM